MTHQVFIGTAHWQIPKEYSGQFLDEGMLILPSAGLILSFFVTFEIS